MTECIQVSVLLMSGLGTASDLRRTVNSGRHRSDSFHPLDHVVYYFCGICAAEFSGKDILRC